MSINSIRINGFKRFALNKLNDFAPKFEAIKEKKAILKSTLKLYFILLAYWYAATDVPDKDAILLVPKRTDKGLLGKLISNAGI